MDGSLMVGKGDRLSFEELRDDERAIIKSLEAAHSSGQNVLRIADIMSANGWDEVDEHDCPEDRCEICATALRLGNSKVRNNLRRLVKYGVVERPADGTYALVVEQTASQVAAVAVQPAPRELNEYEQGVVLRVRHSDDPERYRVALKLIEEFKHADCSFYNACIDQAMAGLWEGFSCASCTAYTMPDQDQRVSDILALRALQTASDELEKNGKINRVRGVKPGADAKRTVVDHDEDDEPELTI